MNKSIYKTQIRKDNSKDIAFSILHYIHERLKIMCEIEKERTNILEIDNRIIRDKLNLIIKDGKEND
jgi:hypothetical protein